MECNSCNERLADFLLDELPEAEAVLVQEHLNLCTACMRTYKDLKGTGKALEAVPALRAVQGSNEFKQAVRSQAAVELTEIVGKLPPDKRLKLEARRAARLSRVIERPAPPPTRSALSTSLMLVVIAGIAALTVILTYPRHSISPSERLPLGSLSVTHGKVEQFYVRANEPNTDVKEGAVVLPGSAFSTLENSRARFDFVDGSSLFLGPQSQVTIRGFSKGTDRFVIVLEKGEAGVFRPNNFDIPPPPEPGTPGQQWELRSDVGTAVLDYGDHAYLKSIKGAKNFSGDVMVLAGKVNILKRSGETLGTVEAGSRAKLSADSASFSAEPVKNARVPSWRIDVVSDSDLERLVGAWVKITSRRDGIVTAESTYSRSNSKRLHEWVAIPADKGGTLLNPAAGQEHKHVIPFTAPMTFELTLARDSQRDASFAFGAMKTAEESGVSIDVTKDALLQIREKGRVVRSAKVAVRQSDKDERLRLELNPEGAGFSAQLITATSKTKSLSVQKSDGLCELWVQGLSGGATFEEVKISGVVPAEWLREQLSK
jgi:hypothetical protein